MKITTEWLNDKRACKEEIDWFISQTETDFVKVLEKLITENKLQWANWLIVRVMTYRQYVSYAVYAAEQVIGIYEKKYPNDNRPRLAIEAAKKCIKKASAENKNAAYAAADAAYVAYAAYAADAPYATYTADAAYAADAA